MHGWRTSGQGTTDVRQRSWHGPTWPSDGAPDVVGPPGGAREWGHPTQQHVAGVQRQPVQASQVLRHTESPAVYADVPQNLRPVIQQLYDYSSGSDSAGSWLDPVSIAPATDVKPTRSSPSKAMKRRRASSQQRRRRRRSSSSRSRRGARPSPASPAMRSPANSQGTRPRRRSSRTRRPSRGRQSEGAVAVADVPHRHRSSAGSVRSPSGTVPRDAAVPGHRDPMHSPLLQPSSVGRKGGSTARAAADPRSTLSIAVPHTPHDAGGSPSPYPQVSTAGSAASSHAAVQQAPTRASELFALAEAMESPESLNEATPSPAPTTTARAPFHHPTSHAATPGSGGAGPRAPTPGGDSLAAGVVPPAPHQPRRRARRQSEGATAARPGRRRSGSPVKRQRPSTAHRRGKRSSRTSVGRRAPARRTASSPDFRQGPRVHVVGAEGGEYAVQRAAARAKALAAAEAAAPIRRTFAPTRHGVHPQHATPDSRYEALNVGRDPRGNGRAIAQASVRFSSRPYSAGGGRARTQQSMETSGTLHSDAAAPRSLPHEPGASPMPSTITDPSLWEFADPHPGVKRGPDAIARSMSMPTTHRLRPASAGSYRRAGTSHEQRFAAMQAPVTRLTILDTKGRPHVLKLVPDSSHDGDGRDAGHHATSPASAGMATPAATQVAAPTQQPAGPSKPVPDAGSESNAGAGDGEAVPTPSAAPASGGGSDNNGASAEDSDSGDVDNAAGDAAGGGDADARNVTQGLSFFKVAWAAMVIQKAYVRYKVEQTYRMAQRIANRREIEKQRDKTADRLEKLATTAPYAGGSRPRQHNVRIAKRRILQRKMLRAWNAHVQEVLQERRERLAMCVLARALTSYSLRRVIAKRARMKSRVYVAVRVLARLVRRAREAKLRVHTRHAGATIVRYMRKLFALRRRAKYESLSHEASIAHELFTRIVHAAAARRHEAAVTIFQAVRVWWSRVGWQKLADARRRTYQRHARSLQRVWVQTGSVVSKRKAMMRLYAHAHDFVQNLRRKRRAYAAAMAKVHEELLATHATVQAHHANVLALAMQRMWRGVRSRRLLKFLRVQSVAVARGKNRAARRLQKAWRFYQLRCRVHKRRVRMKRLRRRGGTGHAYGKRGVRVGAATRKRLQRVAHAARATKQSIKSATVVQRAVRRMLMRRALLAAAQKERDIWYATRRLDHLARAVQRQWHAYVYRRHASARLIQNNWRAVLSRRRLRMLKVVIARAKAAAAAVEKAQLVTLWKRRQMVRRGRMLLYCATRMIVLLHRARWAMHYKHEQDRALVRRQHDMARRVQLVWRMRTKRLLRRDMARALLLKKFDRLRRKAKLQAEQQALGGAVAKKVKSAVQTLRHMKPLQVGDRVKARYGGGVRAYPAVIRAIVTKAETEAALALAKAKAAATAQAMVDGPRPGSSTGRESAGAFQEDQAEAQAEAERLASKLRADMTYVPCGWVMVGQALTGIALGVRGRH